MGCYIKGGLQKCYRNYQIYIVLRCNHFFSWCLPFNPFGLSTINFSAVFRRQHNRDSTHLCNSTGTLGRLVAWQIKQGQGGTVNVLANGRNLLFSGRRKKACKGHSRPVTLVKEGKQSMRYYLRWLVPFWLYLSFATGYLEDETLHWWSACLGRVTRLPRLLCKLHL